MCVPATLKTFRSQIAISPAMVAMMASFIEERIHEAFSRLGVSSFAFWVCSGTATTSEIEWCWVFIKRLCEAEKLIGVLALS
jgi:hypothetical protein